ncbi:ATP-binding protein [Burkholderia sp. AU31652]|uniref:ATP-binding protein n=1 Tax=Burkholderia sp. AU31652 TaxID=2015354 RepID=UPI0015C5CA32|nr:ATP-binding protein [Burkholderia sp. AU31652]
MISKFIIEGLHGYKRVEISFSTPYMVLLAENGQGKTTILNLLYACLYGDTKKLNRIQFDRATLIFDNAAPVVIVKNDLPPDVEMPSIGSGRALSYLKRQHTKAELEFVLSRTNEGVPYE